MKSIIPCAALTVVAVILCFFRKKWNYAGALSILCVSVGVFWNLVAGGSLYEGLLCLCCPLFFMLWGREEGGEDTV